MCYFIEDLAIGMVFQFAVNFNNDGELYGIFARELSLLNCIIVVQVSIIE